jgi:HNH endonuclease
MARQQGAGDVGYVLLLPDKLMRPETPYQQVRRGRPASVIIRRDPTHAELLERLAYDPGTGIFRHRKSVGKGRAGEVAGSRNAEGYVAIRLFNRLQAAHRLAWLYMTGEWPPDGFTIDHKNGIRSDNRWQNLRLADDCQQNWNLPVLSTCQSGLRGAWPCATTGRWQSMIIVRGERIWLGRFDTAEQAAAAYAKAEAIHHGEYRRVARVFATPTM